VFTVVEPLLRIRLPATRTPRDDDLARVAGGRLRVFHAQRRPGACVIGFGSPTRSSEDSIAAGRVTRSIDRHAAAHRQRIAARRRSSMKARRRGRDQTYGEKIKEKLRMPPTLLTADPE
jgi:hypothetical protein